MRIRGRRRSGGRSHPESPLNVGREVEERYAAAQQLPKDSEEREVLGSIWFSASAIITLFTLLLFGVYVHSGKEAWAAVTAMATAIFAVIFNSCVGYGANKRSSGDRWMWFVTAFCIFAALVSLGVLLAIRVIWLIDGA